MAESTADSQIVFVVRHGERADNVDPNWQKRVAWGRERPYDPPLTDVGQCQAAEVGENIKPENVHCVLSSPFFRCLQTAQQIANAAISPPTIRIYNPLCEFLHPCCGIRVPPVLPAVDLPSHGICLDENGDGRCKLPTYPENYQMCCERQIQALHTLADRYWPHSIVLVTHGYAVSETFRYACPERGDDVWGADYCAYVKLCRSSKRGGFSFVQSHGIRMN